MLTVWKGAPSALGLLPYFLNETDPRSAREQFNTNYAHGGGWDPFPGFVFDKDTRTLTYPDDPPLEPVGEARFRDELILVYPHAWVLVLQPDDSWEVSRLD